jgi:hypothetical protein
MTEFSLTMHPWLPTIIMYARKLRPILFALLLSVAGLSTIPQLHAQTARAGPYQLKAYFGGGLSQYVTTPGGPPAGVPVDYTKTGLAATARVLWCPDHLIRLGLESGWTNLYSYKFGSQSEGEETLTAVPVIAVWSMNVLHVDLFAGAGYYHLTSKLNYLGTVNVSTWSLGWLAAASYTHQLSDNWGIAGEVKWMNAVESEDAALTFQVQMVWKFLEW